MKFKRSTAVAAIGVGFVCLALSLLAQTGETFKARLTALPADAKTRPELAGLASVTATLAGTKLSINGTFEGLRSPATAAHLQMGVAAGVRGPSIQDLTISKATSGTITGSLDLNPKQLETLRKGGLYIQIHSEKAPDGVIWGWLLK